MTTKNSIVERLLDQGHINIKCADRILNKKGEYLQDIEDLHRDGPISTGEAITLMSEDFSVDKIQYVPYQPNPYWTSNPDWTYDPNRPGQPWYTTTSFNTKE